MRTILQVLSLLLFSALFVFATYKLPNWLPADIYLRLDPLLGLNAVFPAREIIGRALWALITIGATVVIGRFFCAYVCPVGISIDFLDVLFFKKKKRPGLKFETSLRKVRPAWQDLRARSVVASGVRLELPSGATLPLSRTFGDVPAGEALAYVGSSGLVEIGVHAGRADQRFNLSPGQTVTLLHIEG